jgi:hypothetical protein
MNYTQTPPDKDPRMWDLAQRRASFKRHLATYIVINIFLWLIWYFTGRNGDGDNGFPWPVWSTLGWGVGLAFHYIGAYVTPQSNSADREYEKLMRNRKE